MTTISISSQERQRRVYRKRFPVLCFFNEAEAIANLPSGGDFAYYYMTNGQLWIGLDECDNGEDYRAIGFYNPAE